MAAYLICLTSGSGIPVFTRSVGNVKPLPFPVIGSLNAVHMFAANHDAVLKSTTTDDARITWKEYHNSLVLILVRGRDASLEAGGSDVSGGEAEGCKGGEEGTSLLLDLVWDALVLMYGSEGLVDVRNVEAFKRDVKVCYQLVDSLLLQATSPLFSDLTGAVDVTHVPDMAVLQTCVEAFAEAAESPYGCLMVGGRVLAATERWWALTARELCLLSRLVACMGDCSARDVPVYLPHGSPTVPHRLLTFELINNITACVICGPTPSLVTLEREVSRFWAPAIDNLRTARKTSHRNIPASLEVDPNILGFLLVNTASHRCLSSVGVSRDPSGGRSQAEELVRLEKRRAVLRSFYSLVTGAYFNTATDDSGDLCHEATDTYIVCSGHKCYAHRTGSYQIFVLFTPKTPTFAMRSVTQKTLNLLTKDKNCPL